MDDHREIKLLRDCQAIRIPSGDTITLDAGATVIVTQSLGGSFTVATHAGLARIAGTDADALGLQPLPEPALPQTPAGEIDLEKAIWDQLKTCYDPEIPVNIVDLGLVYDCAVIEHETGVRNVEIKMTLTAPGCGMGPSIAADVQRKVLTLPGVDSANVELVWDPVWNQDMISEPGRMKLGMV